MSVPAATAGTTALGGVRICRAGSLITGQQVPDFPHGHIRDVLRGDLGKQLPQIGKGSRALGTACKIPVCFGHLSCTEIPEQLLGDPARS